MTSVKTSAPSPLGVSVDISLNVLASLQVSINSDIQLASSPEDSCEDNNNDADENGEENNKTSNSSPPRSPRQASAYVRRSLILAESCGQKVPSPVTCTDRSPRPSPPSFRPSHFQQPSHNVLSDSMYLDTPRRVSGGGNGSRHRSSGGGNRQGSLLARKITNTTTNNGSGTPTSFAPISEEYSPSSGNDGNDDDEDRPRFSLSDSMHSQDVCSNSPRLVLGLAAGQRMRKTWQRDDTARQCTRCEASFSTFVRRHHCICCGRIFCADCSKDFVEKPSDWRTSNNNTGEVAAAWPQFKATSLKNLSGTERACVTCKDDIANA